jgi:hypothetical protein
MIKLDWSQLLGFDQAHSPPNAEHATSSARPRRAQLGAKVGVKTGQKPPGFACGPGTLRRGLRDARA